jgi:hypothetical protein
MRIVSAAVLSLLILTGCGGDSDPEPTSGTPATPRAEPSPISPPVASPTPYPTPVAALTPIVSSGWAVAMFDEGLFAVEIDRTHVAASEPFGKRIALTTVPVSGPLGATYAGSVVEAGETWVYAVQIPLPGVPNPDATLLRTSLTDGRQEELFSFQASMVSRDGISLEPPAAISPDGAYVAFTDIDGLQLFETSSETTRLLAMDSCPTGVEFEKCNGYTAPAWSADSEGLLVTKQLYEGSHLVYVDMSDGATVYEYDGVPGDRKGWSPSNMDFCSLNETFVPGGIFVGNGNASQAIDIADTVPGTAEMCAWSAPRRLAIAYSQPVPPRTAGEYPIRRTMISIRQAATSSASELDLQVPVPGSRLVGWIPSGDGLLLHTTPACEPKPCPNMIISGVMALDGSYQGFTFNPAAVLAIIPTTP